MSFTTVIEFLANKLTAQACRSVSASGDCQYNGEAGRHCAIGWLVPPEMYRPEFEGLPAIDLFGYYPEIAQHVSQLLDVRELTTQDIRTLDAFQYWHDTPEAFAKLWVTGVEYQVVSYKTCLDAVDPHAAIVDALTAIRDYATGATA